jgi:hypothetical protein
MPTTRREDSDYTDRVRQRVAALLAEEPLGFAQLCQRSGGAFPDIIAEVMPVPVKLVVEPGPGTTQTTPHESPGRGEWFFTDETSVSLARQATGSVILLGAPSVAQHVASGLLVDSSPLVNARFHLGNVKHLGVPLERAQVMAKYDSAVVDPPWYADGVIDWLKRASQHVQLGGRIHVALMGDLTRPSAHEERTKILELAGRIGEVELEPEAVRYRTPRFELRALEQSGLPSMPEWRRADRLSITNRNPVAASGPSLWESDWDEFLIGDHTLCVRNAAKMNRSSGTGTIESILPGGDWIAPTVSRRAAAIQAADIWSCENAVARIVDWPRTLGAIRTLSEGASSAEAQYLSEALLEVKAC